MKNYIIQDGCHNCQHVFKKTEYDEGWSYFCTDGAPERPLCMSCSMDETVDTGNESEFEKAYRKWLKWSKNREVEPFGKCDNFKG